MSYISPLMHMIIHAHKKQSIRLETRCNLSLVGGPCKAMTVNWPLIIVHTEAIGVNSISIGCSTKLAVAQISVVTCILRKWRSNERHEEYQSERTLHYSITIKHAYKSQMVTNCMGNDDDSVDHNSLLTGIFIHALAVIRRGAVSIIVASLSITRPAALCSMCGTFVRIELV